MTNLPAGATPGPLPESVPAPLRLGRSRIYLRRFARNRGAVLGAALFALLVLYAVAGGLLTVQGWDESDFTALTQPPSLEHPFGTNQAGNDILAQSVHGLQRSLVIATVVSAATITIAAFVGAGAAYLGGRTERVALATIHFLLVVPSFLILALVSNRVAGDWVVLIVVLTLFGWMSTARVIWAVSTSLRERDWVLMAEFMGVPAWRIVARHIVPHLGALLVVNLTLGVVSTVLSETSLSFLGFGIKAPDVSLGSMLAAGAANITHAPWMFGFPAGLLVLLTVSMTLVGDGLRDALDPTSTAGAHG
ncbi:ABC transporter permease [Promicromonospora sp. NPDC059942]|uniref:ABC transporter permease n=1 Tax=Promicromonospora sp. NPDC059942 TaxID=3347009 RepID=UPI003668142C